MADSMFQISPDGEVTVPHDFQAYPMPLCPGPVCEGKCGPIEKEIPDGLFDSYVVSTRLLPLLIDGVFSKYEK